MLFDSISGSLPKEYCFYYYVLTIFAFISLLITLFTLFVGLLTKKLSIEIFISLLSAPLAMFLIYINNRLLYNMCSASIH